MTFSKKNKSLKRKTYSKNNSKTYSKKNSKKYKRSIKKLSKKNKWSLFGGFIRDGSVQQFVNTFTKLI